MRRRTPLVLTLVILTLVFLTVGCGVRQRDIDAGPAPPPAEDVAVAVDLAVGADAGPDASAPPPPPPPVQAVVDRQAKDAILTLIAEAQERVDVYQFEFVQSGSVIDVRNALIVAAARGVQVRVLMDEEPDANVEALELLTSAGIQARIAKHSKRMHLKIFSADGEVVLVGSTNMSGASLDFNHEANVLLRAAELVAFFDAYLESVWNDAGHDPDVVVSTAGPTGSRVWLDGGYLSLALPALDAATERVDLIVFGVNLNPQFPDGPVMNLAETVYAAADRGVKVRVILERSDWNHGLNDLNEYAADEFTKHGIEVRFDTLEITTHCKLLLVDDKALVGTNNWGYNGLVIDHEAGVQINDSSAVADFDTYFAERWAEATPY